MAAPKMAEIIIILESWVEYFITKEGIHQWDARNHH